MRGLIKPEYRFLFALNTIQNDIGTIFTNGFIRPGLNHQYRASYIKQVFPGKANETYEINRTGSRKAVISVIITLIQL